MGCLHDATPSNTRLPRRDRPHTTSTEIAPRWNGRGSHLDASTKEGGYLSPGSLLDPFDPTLNIDPQTLGTHLNLERTPSPPFNVSTTRQNVGGGRSSCRREGDMDEGTGGGGRQRGHKGKGLSEDGGGVGRLTEEGMVWVCKRVGDAYTPPSLPSIIPCASSIAVAIAIAMLTREVFQDKMSVLVPCKSVNARPRYPLRRNGLVPGLEVVELGGSNHEERMHFSPPPPPVPHPLSLSFSLPPPSGQTRLKPAARTPTSSTCMHTWAPDARAGDCWGMGHVYTAPDARAGDSREDGEDGCGPPVRQAGAGVDHMSTKDRDGEVRVRARNTMGGSEGSVLGDAGAWALNKRTGSQWKREGGRQVIGRQRTSSGASYLASDTQTPFAKLERREDTLRSSARRRGGDARLQEVEEGGVGVGLGESNG
ncbi:hypothetical protein FA13DRAFT_1713804 [Coprinellus micaceus]|uniref:Uncharacterized protein n=1 Tax=Coprinellus micaceus TaxID=71717 RepID=A0A4Y7SV57_COPMI|nr:hypothetical protein FA13DRAFT_1713804 [Coprinellus micaceus]